MEGDENLIGKIREGRARWLTEGKSQQRVLLSISETGLQYEHVQEASRKRIRSIRNSAKNISYGGAEGTNLLQQKRSMYNRQGRKDTGTQIDRKTEKYKERFLDILRILLQACSNIDNVGQKNK